MLNPASLPKLGNHLSQTEKTKIRKMPITKGGIDCPSIDIDITALPENELRFTAAEIPAGTAITIANKNATKLR
jgi:hypothetical protein